MAAEICNAEKKLEGTGKKITIQLVLTVISIIGVSYDIISHASTNAANTVQVAAKNTAKLDSILTVVKDNNTQVNTKIDNIVIAFNHQFDTSRRSINDNIINNCKSINNNIKTNSRVMANYFEQHYRYNKDGNVIPGGNKMINKK